MLDKTRTEQETHVPFNLLEAQERGAALFTRFNELTAKTTRAFWESQTELLRLEIEQAAKAFAPPKIDEDPGVRVSACCNQMHDQGDRIIAQMRRINDLYKDYGWQLLALYSDALRHAASASSARP